jgi:phosphate starvation-inducible PhoH-like protein
MGNKYSKKVKAAKVNKTKVTPEIPWKNSVEPDAPYHPSAKLGVLKVVPRSPNQKTYLDAIEQKDAVFGIGPAGSGKTFLTVAKAVQWLAKKGNRLVLVRPAVEAGEKLGFLPGTMQDKVDPYLRPLYDALYTLMDAQKVDAYLDDGIIEIAALAFMRGRTLNNSFIIIDEAQNTTQDQMKMMLTRMGKNSKMVINGDVTQIDLPNKSRSGLLHAEKVLRDKSENIFFQDFEEEDIVRHPLVQEICRLYEEETDEDTINS